jgi:hypothetical protein
MAWKKIDGMDAVLWEPEPQPAEERKYHCPDCDWCQVCSDTRCNQCLSCKNHGVTKGKGKKGKRRACSRGSKS